MWWISGGLLHVSAGQEWWITQRGNPPRAFTFQEKHPGETPRCFSWKPFSAVTCTPSRKGRWNLRRRGPRPRGSNAAHAAKTPRLFPSPQVSRVRPLVLESPDSYGGLPADTSRQRGRGRGVDPHPCPGGVPTPANLSPWRSGWALGSRPGWRGPGAASPGYHQSFTGDTPTRRIDRYLRSYGLTYISDVFLVDGRSGSPSSTRGTGWPLSPPGWFLG